MLEKINSLFPEEWQLPEYYQNWKSLKQDYYLIDGELRHWKGALQKVYSPILIKTPDGMEKKLIGEAPLLDENAAVDALDTASKAYSNGRGVWPTMLIAERIKRVQKFTLSMLKQRQKIVILLQWETGKSVTEAEREFDRTVQYIYDTIEAAKELDRNSSRFIIQQGIIGQIRRAPLGVVLCMGPYNFPLYETFTTLIPALVMGNTILMKPPRFGILLFEPLLELFRDYFPAGVVNTVYGDGDAIVPSLMASGKVDVFGFVGTHKVADSLRAKHPRPHRLRCVLGLDAKNPAVILSDADLDLTVAECIQGSLTFNGQRCTALKIMFVHTSIVDEFLRRMSVAIKALKCGMPWEEGVTITPLPEPEKPNYLKGLLDDALLKGAHIMNQDGGVQSGSIFYPALLYPVNSAMRVYNEEQFGPLIPVVPFDDISQPIEYIVESEYGQQASIFGQNSDMLAQLVDALVNQVCRININSQCQRSPDSFPFNGRKNSADGTQSVADALRIFSIRIVVATRETDYNREIINNIVRERKSHFLSTDYML